MKTRMIGSLNLGQMRVLVIQQDEDQQKHNHCDVLAYYDPLDPRATAYTGRRMEEGKDFLLIERPVHYNDKEKFVVGILIFSWNPRDKDNEFLEVDNPAPKKDYAVGVDHELDPH